MLTHLLDKAQTYKVYRSLLQWSTSACVTEPCITAGLTNEELIQFTGTPLELPNISCHSQAVEREVKLTTECSAAVLGIETTTSRALHLM